jgi:hypothetical protein
MCVWPRMRPILPTEDSSGAMCSPITSVLYIEKGIYWVQLTQVDCQVADPRKTCKRNKLKITGDTGSNSPYLERCLARVCPDPDPSALVTVKIFQSKASSIVIMICIIVVTVITLTFRGRFCTPDRNYCQTHM